jgi:hypothetical protein
MSIEDKVIRYIGTREEFMEVFDFYVKESKKFDKIKVLIEEVIASGESNDQCRYETAIENLISAYRQLDD